MAMAGSWRQNECVGPGLSTRGASGSTNEEWCSINITTFNMNGPGIAKRRQDLITETLATLPEPSLIFCQELPGHFQRVIGAMAFEKTGNEAGVVWDPRDFEQCDDSPKTTDKEIRSIRDSLQESKNEASQLLSRLAMATLKASDNGKKFLAVSWHGPKNNYTLEKREETFWVLIHFCKEVSRRRKNVPFIIGGDFNFDTVELDEELLSQDGISRSTYELGPRLKEKDGRTIPYKDTFVFSNGIEVTGVRSFDINPFQKRVADPRSGRVYEEVFDHDLIHGVLEIIGPSANRNDDTSRAQTEDKEVSSLQRRFETIHLSGLDDYYYDYDNDEDGDDGGDFDNNYNHNNGDDDDDDDEDDDDDDEDDDDEDDDEDDDDEDDDDDDDEDDDEDDDGDDGGDCGDYYDYNYFYFDEDDDGDDVGDDVGDDGDDVGGDYWNDYFYHSDNCGYYYF